MCPDREKILIWHSIWCIRYTWNLSARDLHYLNSYNRMGCFSVDTPWRSNNDSASSGARYSQPGCKTVTIIVTVRTCYLFCFFSAEHQILAKNDAQVIRAVISWNTLLKINLSEIVWVTNFPFLLVDLAAASPNLGFLLSGMSPNLCIY